jgi:hypothetical protein
VPRLVVVDLAQPRRYELRDVAGELVDGDAFRDIEGVRGHGADESGSRVDSGDVGDGNIIAPRTLDSAPAGASNGEATV